MCGSHVTPPWPSHSNTTVAWQYDLLSKVQSTYQLQLLVEWTPLKLSAPNSLAHSHLLLPICLGYCVLSESPFQQCGVSVWLFPHTVPLASLFPFSAHRTCSFLTKLWWFWSRKRGFCTIEWHIDTDTLSTLCQNITGGYPFPSYFCGQASVCYAIGYLIDHSGCGCTRSNNMLLYIHRGVKWEIR